MFLCSMYVFFYDVSVFVLFVLAELHWEAGRGFPSPGISTLLKITSLDDFVCTTWYMAPASANRFKTFLPLFSVFSKRLNLAFFCLQWSTLFPNTSGSVSSDPALSTSAASSLALSSLEPQMLCYLPERLWATSSPPSPPLGQSLSLLSPAKPLWSLNIHPLNFNRCLVVCFWVILYQRIIKESFAQYSAHSLPAPSFYTQVPSLCFLLPVFLFSRE